jgi:cell division transport system ATP-binding protein
VVGSGPESPDPEQPAADSVIISVATTASVARATRGRRSGGMQGSLGGAGFLEPWASSSNLDPVIRFEKVSKTYPGQGHSALDNVSIDVEKGEFVFLVGASGSGKSTALRLVLRESRPTAGRVYVAGKEINRLASWKVPRLRRQIGTVFQDFRLLPNKTVNENVAFALQVIGKSRSEITKVVPETLDLVGLEGKGDRMPDELSGGEQQRVAIARAFVNRPMILIADEPTGNLDPQTSVGIMRLLDRINRTGTTVVMATHDDDIVDQMRKRVVELSAGQVVRDQAQGGYGFSH